MIKAKFFYQQNEKIIERFEITGHAESVASGEKDLVCAGVSAIVFGILNSLNEDNLEIIVEENIVKIDVKKHNINNEIILNTLYTSLKTIEESNKKYIIVKTKLRR